MVAQRVGKELDCCAVTAAGRNRSITKTLKQGDGTTVNCRKPIETVVVVQRLGGVFTFVKGVLCGFLSVHRRYQDGFGNPYR